MKKLILITCFIIPFLCNAQEFGFITGTTKQGINPKNAQPIYGISLSKQAHKNVNVETNFMYSQRMKENKIQADYISFIIMGKFGTSFNKKINLFYGYGFSMNPTLDHSNPENHTYISHQETIGCQIRILPKTILDMKFIYDIDLTSGYVKDGEFYKYKGLIIMTGMKFVL